ncbi:glycine betaine ABC transporter substrate-binding protein [Methanofollis tationis]|uniref:Glycine/betaine ABC transporter substrate-binding protein n=1 Tax=Methanofollis tationis TaxID=81417 RepID=A0A7K4HKV6_9EURY|nr:glycine betaine ABC transporter substrate-binding protein [Methanofollis tationis]NVO65906.1 glycine/betaine ABC transporter substrate-binding protein [Methanofollis tationis]
MKWLPVFWVVLITVALCASGCTGTSGQTVVVGGKTFNEQYILAEMIALLLEEEGYAAEVKANLNDATLFEGIKKGQVDVYVEYTGTAYSQLLKLPPMTVWDPDEVYLKVEEGLAGEAITVLYGVGFRDDYTIAVPEAWAAELNVTAISDLAPHAAAMDLGTDYVFPDREDGLPQLGRVYNFSFGRVRQMSPTLMYEVIKSGEVDAITPYTTDTRVDLYNLRILDDDRSAFPPYHAIVVANEKIAGDQKAVEALSVLSERIDSGTMRSLNYQFDVEKKEARDIARGYLVSEGLIAG